MWRGHHWTDAEELLASAVELLDGLNKQTALARGVPKMRIGNPLRIPRPGAAPEKPANVVSIAEFVERNQHARR